MVCKCGVWESKSTYEGSLLDKMKTVFSKFECLKIKQFDKGKVIRAMEEEVVEFTDIITNETKLDDGNSASMLARYYKQITKHKKGKQLWMKGNNLHKFHNKMLFI